MIAVLACGALTTVQDLGRFGHRRLGIGTAGAMDALALRVGNLLLGNDPSDAAIEITASAFRVRFERSTAFALTGAEGGGELDGLSVPPWWAHPASAGSELLVRAPKVGLRTCLAVAGGIDVPEVLGSRSTDVKSGIGGLHGRPLVAGDHLPVGAGDRPRLPERGFGVRPPGQALPQADAAGEGVTTIRAIPAAQHDGFTDEARARFWGSPWTLRPDSNRIGLRLDGPELLPERHQELLSHGIIPGVVQVPRGGQPIVQMRDGNTAGGYPKIAVVIEADLWRLAQVRLGGRVRFARVDRPAGIAAGQEVAAYLDRIGRLAAIARESGR